MASAMETRASLLLRLRDASDQEAWRQFVDTYGPLVYRYARRRGLQDADAADLTQQVLWQVSEAVGRFDYDPRRGTFRGWLFGVVRRQWSKGLRREGKHARGRDAVECLEGLAAPPSDDEAEWDREYERQLFLQAARLARGQFSAMSWGAFWRTAMLGEDAVRVAQALDMTVGAVYTAKSRVLDRVREIIRDLRANWDEP